MPDSVPGSVAEEGRQMNVMAPAPTLRRGTGGNNVGGRFTRMVHFDVPAGQGWDGSGVLGAGSSDGMRGASFPRSMGDTGSDVLRLNADGDDEKSAAGAPPLWNPAQMFNRVQYGRSFRFLIDGAAASINPGITVDVKVPIQAYAEVGRSANFLWMVVKESRGPNLRPRPNPELVGMLERLEILKTLLWKQGLTLPPYASGGEDGDPPGTHLAILTTPEGRRRMHGGEGHSAAFIYDVEVAAGGGAAGCSPSCAVQTIHQAEVAITALALSQGVADTVAMTFSFFPLGLLFYLQRGGSAEDGPTRISGNVLRGVMHGAVMGTLSAAEYEEFAIALVEYVLAKFGMQTLQQLCRRRVPVARLHRTTRSDLYDYLKRYMDSDLTEPDVDDSAAETNVGANAMLLRPQMASFHQRLHMIEEAKKTSKANPGVKDEDEDDWDGDNKEMLVQVRHRSRLQRVLDGLLCGAGGSKRRSALKRRTADDYDPHEKIEVSVMENIAWTWGWLMKHEKMNCFAIFMLVQYLALWAAAGYAVVDILFSVAVTSDDEQWMWTLIGVMVVGSLLYAQVNYVLDCANPSGAGFVPQMQVHMLQQLGYARMEYLDMSSNTEVMNILENEIPRLSMNIDALIDGFSNLWQMIATLALCGTLSPGMTVGICCTMPFFAVLGYRLGKAVNKASADLQARENLFKVEMNENLSSNSTKKLLGLHALLDGDLVGKQDYVGEGYDILDTMVAQQDRALAVLETALKLIVIISGTLLVSTYQSGGETEEEKLQARFMGVIPGMTMGQFVAFYMASETIGGFIVEISKAYRTFSTTAVALEMLLMLDYKLPDDVLESPVVLDPDQQPVLKVTGVNYAYHPPPGVSIKHTPLLFRNLNFLVEPGKKVGIVGKSGSGKSTLMKLLARLYYPMAGDITVTGIALKDLDVHRTVAMMEQETLLFDDNVLNNLVLGDESIPMTRIEFACKMAAVHSDILDFEGGFDHHVGVGGRKLSGGQRQRLAIARTLLRNCPITIMDEPCSAQEPGVTAQIGHNLSMWQHIGSDDLKYPSTILAVTHNYVMIDDWDLVCVFQDGAIVEYDTKETLLARKGRYYRMLNSTNGLLVDGTGRASITPERLAEIWLFAAPEIPVEELKLVADACQTRHVAANETLYQYSDEADAMYVLVQGQLQDIQYTEKGDVDVLPPRIWDAGDVVGELNLLNDSKRPWGTDAKAKSRAILLHLPKQMLNRMTSEQEDGSAPLLPVVSEVVREMSYQVASVRSAARLQLVWAFCGVNERLLTSLGEIMDIIVEESENFLFDAPERECNTLYFLVKGRVAVKTTAVIDGVNETLTKATIEEGMHFGEETVMYNSRRMRIAKTVEPCIMLTLDRTRFRRFVAMVRAEEGDKAADDLTQNLTNYRRYVANPGLIPLDLWPLATLNEDQLAYVPALMTVASYAEGTHVCVMNESDEDAHIILRGKIVVQIMRSESVTMTKELREGDAVNATTLAGDANAFGELVLSAECTEPTVLLTLSRRRLWQIPAVDPAYINNVATQRQRFTTFENLRNIGLEFVASNGKDAAICECMETKVYTQDKLIIDAADTSDASLLLVAHGLVTVKTAAGTTKTVKPGQYVVTTGRTLPRQTAPSVTMVRDAATVTAASAYTVVVTLDLGYVSEALEAEERKMEEKLQEQHRAREKLKERVASLTVIVRAMELQLGIALPKHPRELWRKGTGRIQILSAIGLRDALDHAMMGRGTAVSAEAAGSLQVELARIEQRMAMLQKDVEERSGRLKKLMKRWEELGVLRGEDPTAEGLFSTVTEATEQTTKQTLTGPEVLDIPGLVPETRSLSRRSVKGSRRSLKNLQHALSITQGKSEERPLQGGPSQLSQLSLEGSWAGSSASFNTRDGEEEAYQRYSDRFVRHRLRQVPVVRRNYPEEGAETVVGFWTIADIEDTKTKAKRSLSRSLSRATSTSRLLSRMSSGRLSSGTLSPRTPRPAPEPGTSEILSPRTPRPAPEPGTPGRPLGAMHVSYVFNPALSSDRLTEMSRLLNEKDRNRKSMRDLEISRLSALYRKNHQDDEQQTLVEENLRNSIDKLRRLGYGQKGFEAIYAALAVERKKLVPHYRAIAGRIADLWRELKVPPTSRMHFKLNATDDEVDELLIDKLEKELARLEDVNALLSPLVAKQRIEDGQALNFDQAYSKLMEALEFMGDPVPTVESCMQAGIVALRETASRAEAECSQRQEKMASSLSAIQNYWNVLDVPILEQMSFNDSDLSLENLLRVKDNLEVLEKLAEQRSIKRDGMVVSLTEAWSILKTRQDVRDRTLKAHIGLKLVVLDSLQAELNKVNKVVQDYRAKEELIGEMEKFWAKLRFPAGETRWARDCLHYQVEGCRELLGKELKRLKALFKAESKAAEAQIMSNTADAEKAGKEIIRLQKVGYEYQVKSAGFAMSAASDRVKNFTAIQIALSAPVECVFQILGNTGASQAVDLKIRVKDEACQVEAAAIQLQSLFRGKFARRRVAKLRTAVALGVTSPQASERNLEPPGSGGSVKIQPIQSERDLEPPVSGGSVKIQPNLGVGSGVAGTSMRTAPTRQESKVDEKAAMAKKAREERAKREMQDMNAAIVEIKALYKGLKLPEAEINKKLQEFSTSSSGTSLSVGATLAKITQEINLTNARIGIRDSIVALQKKLPKLWKKNGMDGAEMLKRLSLAITHPEDLQLNVDAELNTLSLLTKAKKFYGNKKKLNAPEAFNAIAKEIATLNPLGRQALLQEDREFIKMTTSAETLMKKAKVAKAEIMNKIRRCAQLPVGEPRMEAIKRLIADTEAEVAKRKEEEAAKKKAPKKANTQAKLVQATTVEKIEDTDDSDSSNDDGNDDDDIDDSDDDSTTQNDEEKND